jgi:hypothetical protein
MNMKETIDLYNYWHNGDLFYSRILISMLSEKYDINFYHKSRPSLFYDLPINEIASIPDSFGSETTDIQNKKINTWIGQRGNHDSCLQYLRKTNVGCTFENHHFLCKEICDQLGVETGSRELYLPYIEKDNIINKSEIDRDIKRIKERFGKIVLISNGDVLSGQSPNFDFYPVIRTLAESNKNTAFLITENRGELPENAFDISSITRTSPDLLEIAYISIYCDIIVGRASGPYCFAQHRDNLLDSEKTFIAFTNNEQEAKFYQEMKARFVWSDNYSHSNVFGIINHEIKN